MFGVAGDESQIKVDGCGGNEGVSKLKVVR